MTLPPGKANTSLADAGFQTLGQRLDELRKGRALHRLADLLFAGVRTRQQNIRAQGFIEQIGILGYERDLIA